MSRTAQHGLNRHVEARVAHRTVRSRDLLIVMANERRLPGLSSDHVSPTLALCTATLPDDVGRKAPQCLRQALLCSKARELTN